MKKIVLIFLILALTSCFKEEKETKTQTWVTQTQQIIPKNEKTTSVEEEFSQDLNGLLKLIDEEPNE